jgi:hypothetical protein
MDGRVRSDREYHCIGYADPHQSPVIPLPTNNCSERFARTLSVAVQPARTGRLPKAGGVPKRLLGMLWI